MDEQKRMGARAYGLESRFAIREGYTVLDEMFSRNRNGSKLYKGGM